MSDLETFKSTLNDENPPKEITGVLKAMWWDAKGDWERAHQTAQEINNQDGAWVHAYLHRKEGDEGNAGYWYSRASRPFSQLLLEEEWDEIVGEFLNRKEV